MRKRVSFQQGRLVKKPRAKGPDVWVLRSMDGDALTTCIRLRVVVPMIQLARCLQPFLILREEEMPDYGAGFNAGLAGEGVDENKSEAWLRGWAEAQE
jgi:hypothetical protein